MEIFFNADTSSDSYDLEWYKKSVKYVLMHSKTWLTDGQYNLMIDCVLGIIFDCRNFYDLCFVYLNDYLSIAKTRTKMESAKCRKKQ